MSATLGPMIVGGDGRRASAKSQRAGGESARAAATNSADRGPLLPLASHNLTITVFDA